eukprot:PRCOL_00002338-RA
MHPSGGGQSGAGGGGGADGLAGLDFLEGVPIVSGAGARRAQAPLISGFADEKDVAAAAAGAPAAAADGMDFDVEREASLAAAEAFGGAVASGHCALVGRPNAGKSSLLNAALGAKLSIVTHKAQTTRNSVLGIYDDDDAQVVFVDTPGVLRREADLLDSRMNSYVSRALRDADVALEPALAALPAVVKRVPTLLVLNKVDLLGPEQRERVRAWHEEHAEGAKAVLMTSAETGEGVEELMEAIKELLPTGPKYFPEDQLSTEPERFFVGELVREKLFEMFDDEVPYSSTVEVETFKEAREAGRKDEIHVAVVVERDGQKGIIIGKGGAQIRALSEASRAGIEAFLGREVVLNLRVKVRKGWRKSDVHLRGYGYGKK